MARRLRGDETTKGSISYPARGSDEDQVRPTCENWHYLCGYPEGNT